MICVKCCDTRVLFDLPLGVRGCDACEGMTVLEHVGLVYAHPCGHRQGVGNARTWNESKGWKAPEDVHIDPEFGLISEWE